MRINYPHTASLSNHESDKAAGEVTYLLEYMEMVSALKIMTKIQ
jgi:hypothetical protein